MSNQNVASDMKAIEVNGLEVGANNPLPTTPSADNEKTIAVVIPLNSQSTDEIDARGYRIAVIEMPAAWDAAPLAFTATTIAGGTHTPVIESGIEVYEPAAASQTITIASNALALDGLKFIKIWSGKLGARINQTAARTLNVTLKR